MREALTSRCASRWWPVRCDPCAAGAGCGGGAWFLAVSSNLSYAMLPGGGLGWPIATKRRRVRRSIRSALMAILHTRSVGPVPVVFEEIPASRGVILSVLVMPTRSADPVAFPQGDRGRHPPRRAQRLDKDGFGATQGCRWKWVVSRLSTTKRAPRAARLLLAAANANWRAPAPSNGNSRRRVRSWARQDRPGLRVLRPACRCSATASPERTSDFPRRAWTIACARRNPSRPLQFQATARALRWRPAQNKSRRKKTHTQKWWDLHTQRKVRETSRKHS